MTSTEPIQRPTERGRVRRLDQPVMSTIVPNQRPPRVCRLPPPDVSPGEAAAKLGDQTGLVGTGRVRRASKGFRSHRTPPHRDVRQSRTTAVASVMRSGSASGSPRELKDQARLPTTVGRHVIVPEACRARPQHPGTCGFVTRTSSASGLASGVRLGIASGLRCVVTKV
ncbi:hypothetical protein ACFQ07_33660 [Actinomadura adrarensis]|uniref:Uncharacterized protein n=1 Tax=Actinomadura adrarensis TaxID=1819600 RepID=A0ABW3CT50_9ACTN